MIRKAALVAAIAVTSCGSFPRNAPQLTPHTRERMLPVPHWPELDRWWQEVQDCMGRPSHAPPPALFVWADTALTLHLTPLDGLYIVPLRVIIVPRYTPRIIRHEMVHALLAPDTSHPAWVGVSCGAILRWP